MEKLHIAKGSLANTIETDIEKTIEIIPVKASAGYLNGYDDPEYIEHLDKIKLPFLFLLI